MAVMRNQFTEAMKKDMYTYYWENYPIKTPVWEELFEVVPSDAAYEQFTSAIGLGELTEKPEHEDIESDSPIESYTIVCKNRSFAQKVSFSYESVQDSKKTSLLQSTVSSWGPKVATTKEKFYAKFFNKGAFTAGDDVFNNNITGVVTDATNNVTYDNYPWFDTAHPDKVGNTYVNYVSSRALSHTNLKTSYNDYTVTINRDERGDIIEHIPDTLLVPGALTFTAQEILNTTNIPNSQDNTTNVLSSIVGLTTWQRLTDVDGWFLGQKKKGLMATEREGVSLDFWRDEVNLSYWARIFLRFGGCITNWRYWLAFNISTS